MTQLSEAMPKVFMNDPVFRKLGKVARVAALSSVERSAYDASLKSYRDSYSIAKTERTEGFNEGMEKGIAEGIAKGMEKGMEKGIAEGRAEGRAEGLAEGLRASALNMLKAKLDPNFIHEMTGLSLAEIESLH